ncbi:MAG: DegT/DnrJ/EryC1/StrS family aminotransferase [Planctomycetes bacterium]|nr:DegT/DnrJ/EryC1/StrS family aminotransferase [Planctomycetota bacterium]
MDWVAPPWRGGGLKTRVTALIGAKLATAVTSGTAALIVSLQAMGISPGNSVLVPG